MEVLLMKGYEHRRRTMAMVGRSSAGQRLTNSAWTEGRMRLRVSSTERKNESTREGETTHVELDEGLQIRLRIHRRLENLVESILVGFSELLEIRDGLRGIRELACGSNEGQTRRVSHVFFSRFLSKADFLREKPEREMVRTSHLSNHAIQVGGDLVLVLVDGASLLFQKKQGRRTGERVSSTRDEQEGGEEGR